MSKPIEDLVNSHLRAHVRSRASALLWEGTQLILEAAHITAHPGPGLGEALKLATVGAVQVAIGAAFGGKLAAERKAPINDGLH